MFEDMRQAIEDVITQYRETGVKTEYVIDSQAIDTLEKVYNLYFVEPDEDEEWQRWQNAVSYTHLTLPTKA